MSTTHNHPTNKLVAREPTCPNCLAQKGAPSTIPKTRPTRLTKAESVWKVTGGIIRETVRHAAHKTGLLHVYKLYSPISCSFPDRTRHKEGLIIQTLCGKIVNVGRDCGRSYVIGLDEVIEYADEVEKNELNLAKLKLALRKLLPQASKADAEVEELRKYSASIDKHIPELSASLQKRAHSTNPKDRRVDEEIEEKSINKDGSVRMRRVTVSAVLEGLSLWGSTPPSAILPEAETLVASIKSQLSGLTRDIPIEHVLGQRVDTIRRKIAEQNRWVEEASKFWIASNLKRAVGAAHLRREVVCKGSDIIFRDPNRGNVRMAIRRKGLFHLGDRG